MFVSEIVFFYLHQEVLLWHTIEKDLMLLPYK